MSVLRRLRYGKPIVVVSGLPRSGTSMAMRMLGAGGMPILTDGVRGSDVSNPHGYFEFEAVKALHHGGDAAWLHQAHGKAIKIISFLLTWLPETHDYRVVFMRRNLQEILASQHAMLAQRGEPTDTEDADRMHAIYQEHLEEVGRFLASRACFSTLNVDYARALADPGGEARRIDEFLGGTLDVDAMTAAIDPLLHRQRRDPSA
jgi:hypothetical protein